jgi:hypothetical protein
MESVHLRRALLLFAVVLAVAALAATISAPRNSEQREQAATQEASPPPRGALPPAELRLPTKAGADTAKLRAGTSALLSVAVGAPGLVEIPGLGLAEAAEPTTPATFDVLTRRTGRYEVRFTRAGSDEARRIGALIVSE